MQAMPGVLYYVDAKAIPKGGTNDWKRGATPEPVFAAGRSEYAGQALGLIVAETREVALAAAAIVAVTYANQGDKSGYTIFTRNEQRLNFYFVYCKSFLFLFREVIDKSS
jgi:xanthine dehydrogenase molybdopterin-binding subunit B